jgi:hypothetical protein
MAESSHKMIEDGLLDTLQARLNSAFEKRWTGSYKQTRRSAMLFAELPYSLDAI